MEIYSVTIPFRYPSLNEYIHAMNRNKFLGNNMKQKYQKMTMPYLSDLPKPFENPVIIHFIWIEPNRRRDKDNVRFACKFILDALQKNGNIINDNNNYVKGFSDDFRYEKEARVILNIEEVKE